MTHEWLHPYTFSPKTKARFTHFLSWVLFSLLWFFSWELRNCLWLSVKTLIVLVGKQIPKHGDTLIFLWRWKSSEDSSGGQYLHLCKWSLTTHIYFSERFIFLLLNYWVGDYFRNAALANIYTPQMFLFFFYQNQLSHWNHQLSQPQSCQLYFRILNMT